MVDGVRILQAEQIDNGVLISFSDGRTALYSADFLHHQIGQALEIHDEEEDDPDRLA